METAIAFTILISPILLILLVHIVRDVRGKSRNSSGACYSCGASLAVAGMRVLHHHKGGTYIYCQRCGDRHELSKGIVVSILALVGAAALGMAAVSTFESNAQQSLLLAVGALTIIAVVVAVAIKHVTKKS